MHRQVEMEWAGRRLSMETGRLAKQAPGSVLIRYADTMVLATAAYTRTDTNRDFLPLSVEYREKFYAAGKIPGGFFKREGRPQTKEVLSSRLIDRPIRSLLPQHLRREVQIIVNVLSADGDNDSDTLGMIAAGAALELSGVPFDGPLGAVRIGLVEGRFIVNPTFAELEGSRLNLVVAGTEDAVVMVEGGASEISEEEMQRALEIAGGEIRNVIGLVRRLVPEGSVSRFDLPGLPGPGGAVKELVEGLRERVRASVRIAGKLERGAALDAIRDEALAGADAATPEQAGEIVAALAAIEKEEVRRLILDERRRADGRGPDDVRAITIETGVLPRAHGSAIFTRGETQALAVTTLGSSSDEQKVDALEGESWKSYMLHYNFPPFSVGEVKPIRSPGRREIGHGALAERALQAVIPPEEVFPYTIRLVSDILESNGSSSMATVCAGSLALMDAGVPIKTAVAGVAMGLVKDGDRWVTLTDILGLEDHLGDMDFKVAGTRQGITAFQLDSKIGAIPAALLSEALTNARRARLHILDAMDSSLASARPNLSTYAPRIVMIRVPQDKIGEVIGPGGRVIRKLQERTGTTIDIDDEGIVKISGPSDDGVFDARQTIELMTKDPVVGEEYEGAVRSITDFGAFVEFLPGRDGLVHISELEHHRVRAVEDVLKLGETVRVKVVGIDDNGKVRLSRRALLPVPKELPPGAEPHRSRGDQGGGSGREGGSSGGRPHGRDGQRPRRPGGGRRH
ncbi:MAG: polyribonucleotide nucleotidyltransferase [Candidatus Eisenbacteria bacterium]|nr:polyribonucleotide nucleotidyltransferase [Candidatus Eisenbacteria bacterium]